ncbi:MAG: hypothetical protein QOG62_2318 [Thermoleophilaceae bacterium]|jgi:very-short-patch-repair endonuclease|nr:hypothetical protein [Thermoleophilaceae bacterium]
MTGAGLSDEQIKTRIARGSLQRMHRNVYRVGHSAPNREATLIAAVLACGEGSVLCGRSAAHLHQIIRGPVPKPEVLTLTERRVAGITTHRSRTLIAADKTTAQGIPVTTVPRTLVDLAATLTAEQLARACHEAGVKHRTAPRQVEAVLKRRRRTPGAAPLRRILNGDEPVLLSRLESAFIALLSETSLPLPTTNRRAGSNRVDCRWPNHRLTVELDSFRFHNTRKSWEGDRVREREAHARGDAFRRYTWADVFDEPGRVAAEIKRLTS